MTGTPTIPQATQAVCAGPVGDCADGEYIATDNAARVLHALQRTPSARRVDLMHLCHMTRGEVLEACEELMRARLIRSINGGARYAARDRVTA